MGRLENKVAFITGAARGQGRAHAVAYAREGAHVVAVDICAPIEHVHYPLATPEDLQETVRLVEDLDRRCLAIEADARDADAMLDAAQRAVAELGGIDVGIVNHGIVQAQSWDTITNDDWNTMVDVNLSAVWRASRAVIPHIIARGGGALLLTASSAGIRPFYGITAYTAAKHGVVGLAKALAVELAPHWVRVNAICPGNVDTPMVHNQYIHDLFNGGPGGTREKASFPAEACQLLPIDWYPPEAVADAMVYLGSDEGRYVTGTAFVVDAGMTNMPAGIPPIASQRLAELTEQVRAAGS